MSALADRFIKTYGGFSERELRNGIQGILDKTGFTANDLTAYSYVSMSYVNISYEFFSSSNAGTSTVGLHLSFTYLKATQITAEFGVSDKMKDFSERFLDSQIKEKTDEAEEIELKKARLAEKSGRKIHCNPHIRDDINALLELTKQLVSEKKCSQQVLQNLCALAYKQNQHYPSHFWRNFFDNGKGGSFVGSLLTKWGNNLTGRW